MLYTPGAESPCSPLTSPRPSVTRSSSVSGPKSSSSITSPKERRVLDVKGHTIPDRQPLTLVEKHSELLHFIAQKEARCLELRSQLAANEAELVQLKRKWERIVNRGSLDDSSPSSALSTHGNGAVLEGIVEGVQGVGRFIAAGLAIGELSPAPVTSPPTFSRPPSLRIKHSTSQSNSSASTYATQSTRFSQSSASSLGEDPIIAPLPLPLTDAEEDSPQILMVHDTGATPTMSPNPAFEHQRQRREQQADAQPNPALNLEAQSSSSKLLRRRSRDPGPRNMYHPSEEPIASSSRPSSPTETEAMDADDKREAARIKRATHHGTSFPPVSSIPGLAALTVGPASSPVPSWVGSVGKKWEELQRGSTFTKNQKRASVLLSDVSQSIVSALSSPPLTLSKSASPAPSSFSDLSLGARPTATSPTSLLDDDDDGDSVLSSSSILMPQPAVGNASSIPQPRSHSKPDPIWQMLEASSPSPNRPAKTTRKATKPKSHMDEEDEWNW
ncbi:hypothetical protein DXG01_006747 [Tephrocybe rancida]|nr:hypothetical protein DXG01_006747 [Tephrocybe rancida]